MIKIVIKYMASLKKQYVFKKKNVGIFTQENASRNVPSSLLECYNTTEMLNKDNRLPHNLPSLIAIIRKIENTAGLNMDLRTLSLALLHR